MTYLIIALIISIILIIVGNATYEPCNDIPLLALYGGIMGATFSACVIIVILSGSFYCSQKVESQGYESRYGVFTGCQLKDGDRWVDYDKWRYFGD